jgi:hypothetical protein
MRTISTGEPATLGTYRKIALALSPSEDSKAVKYFDNKIAESPNGENEEVVAHESQVLMVIIQMVKAELEADHD